MARQRTNTRRKSDDRDRKLKQKVSILDQEQIEWIDYKDVNLLRRFMSERAKIRARRVTGNDAQQQRAVARAIRVAREMGLLPYSVRQVTHRSKGKGRDRGDRGDRGELAMPMTAPGPPPGPPTEPPPSGDGAPPSVVEELDVLAAEGAEAAESEAVADVEVDDETSTSDGDEETA